MPLWGIPVTLIHSPTRVRCKACGKIRVEAIPWAQGTCRLSTGLIGVLARWATHSRLKAMRDVAWTLRRHEEQILNYFRRV